MKVYEFRLKFHWSLFLSFELTILHYLNQWWLVYRRMYASLGINELNIHAVIRAIIMYPISDNSNRLSVIHTTIVAVAEEYFIIFVMDQELCYDILFG